MKDNFFLKRLNILVVMGMIISVNLYGQELFPGEPVKFYHPDNVSIQNFSGGGPTQEVKGRFKTQFEADKNGNVEMSDLAQSILSANNENWITKLYLNSDDKICTKFLNKENRFFRTLAVSFDFDSLSVGVYKYKVIDSSNGIEQLHVILGQQHEGKFYIVNKLDNEQLTPIINFFSNLKGEFYDPIFRYEYYKLKNDPNDLPLVVLELIEASKGINMSNNISRILATIDKWKENNENYKINTIFDDLH